MCFRIQEDRNEKGMTHRYFELINLWSLESVSSVVFDYRLGLLTKGSKDEMAETFIKVRILR
jgi:hypothetical protein